ncbi:hypothetical protein SLA2020_346170 [Shorea laevis]
MMVLFCVLSSFPPSVVLRPKFSPCQPSWIFRFFNENHYLHHNRYWVYVGAAIVVRALALRWFNWVGWDLLLPLLLGTRLVGCNVGEAVVDGFPLASLAE